MSSGAVNATRFICSFWHYICNRVGTFNSSTLRVISQNASGGMTGNATAPSLTAISLLPRLPVKKMVANATSSSGFDHIFPLCIRSSNDYALYKSTHSLTHSCTQFCNKECLSRHLCRMIHIKRIKAISAFGLLFHTASNNLMVSEVAGAVILKSNKICLLNLEL